MAIEDVLKKGVKVTLDKERVLMYPMNSIRYLTELYGSVGETFEAFLKITPANEEEKKTWKMTTEVIDTLAQFMTAGLMTEDPSITYEEVLTIMDMSNISGAIEAVSASLRAWLPKVVKKEGADSPPPARSK